MSHIRWPKVDISLSYKTRFSCMSHADADAEGQTELGSCERRGGIVLTLPGDQQTTLISEEKRREKRRGGYKPFQSCLRATAGRDFLVCNPTPYACSGHCSSLMMMLVFMEALEQSI